VIQKVRLDALDAPFWKLIKLWHRCSLQNTGPRLVLGIYKQEKRPFLFWFPLKNPRQA
jgi:hypothetical protein